MRIIKERQQATVDELSRELGLTPVTVRHHLEILRGEVLVAPPLLRRRKSPGRPKYVYTLTEKASTLFPKRYDHLASLILGEVRSLLSSPEEVEQMMERIGERIASQAVPSGADGFEAHLVAAVEFLNERGYLARWEPRDDGEYLLHIANCPYERVAGQDREICTIDLAMLTRLLGVSPQRVSWAAEGDSWCAYSICPPDA
ncbi:MAG: ArsR family transcriptional regulator [Chloroflexi bacterium]|nr:ArsR family transcriptional regulator [Chloroflexota bacterium]